MPTSGILISGFVITLASICGLCVSVRNEVPVLCTLNPLVCIKVVLENEERLPTAAIEIQFLFPGIMVLLLLQSGGIGISIIPEHLNWLV
ncbi:hypothetical protein D3C86_1138410 [compost metagenome]